MNALRSNYCAPADAFAAALPSLSASEGERVGVRCFFGTGDPEFKALEKEIKIVWFR